MKLNLSVLFFLAFVCKGLLAQVPQGIPYQSIIRDGSGNVAANQSVKLRFSIRDSIASGTVVYQETFQTSTNSLGLANVNIGMGTVVVGTFSGINWGKNSKFIQVEIDATGGTNFTDMGTTQMMSVPYALYAGSAKTSIKAGTGIIISGDTINAAASISSPSVGVRVGFSSSTTWVCPANVYSITVEVWGGAGGGGGSSAVDQVYWQLRQPYGNPAIGFTTGYWGVAGGSGGSGGYNKQILSVVPGNSYSILIGQGGAGGTGGNLDGANGINGNQTVFNGTVSAPGGQSGQGGIISTPCSSYTNVGAISTNLCVYNGAAGSAGQVTNYIATSSPGLPSYIPSNYLTSMPSSGSQGGAGGALQFSGSGNIIIGANGNPGEGGFCVISY